MPSPPGAYQILRLAIPKGKTESELGRDMGGRCKHQLCAAFRNILDQTPQAASSPKANCSVCKYDFTQRFATFKMCGKPHPKTLALVFRRVNTILAVWLRRGQFDPLLAQQSRGINFGLVDPGRNRPHTHGELSLICSQ